MAAKRATATETTAIAAPAVAPAERPLTPRQARFVEEYMIDLNATQAAIRAGYSAKTAAQQAAATLRILKVAAAVAAAKEARSIRTQITADRVLEEYARIGFSDMRHFVTVQGGVRLKDSAAWSDDDAAAVAEVSETVTDSGGSLKFKLHDKLKALDALAEYTGVKKPAGASLDLNGPVQINVIYESLVIVPDAGE